MSFNVDHLGIALDAVAFALWRLEKDGEGRLGDVHRHVQAAYEELNRALNLMQDQRPGVKLGPQED